MHALDAVSLAWTCADLCDADVQAMFNDYWKRRTRRGAWGSVPYTDRGHHDELCEFLSCLLDGSFLELNQNKDEVALRFPTEVLPRVHSPDLALVEVQEASDGVPAFPSVDAPFMRPTCSRVAAIRQRVCEETGTEALVVDDMLTLPQRRRPPPPLAGPSQLVVPSAVVAGQRRGPAEQQRPSTGHPPCAPPPGRPPRCRPASARERCARAARVACPSGGSSSFGRGGSGIARAAGAGVAAATCAAMDEIRCVARQPLRPSSAGTCRKEPTASRPSSAASCGSSGPRSPGVTAVYPSTVATAGPATSACAPVHYDAGCFRSFAADTRCRGTVPPRHSRPTSAKSLKHRRVFDSSEKPTIYEDHEPSVCSEHPLEDLLGGSLPPAVGSPGPVAHSHATPTGGADAATRQGPCRQLTP